MNIVRPITSLAGIQLNNGETNAANEVKVQVSYCSFLLRNDRTHFRLPFKFDDIIYSRTLSDSQNDDAIDSLTIGGILVIQFDVVTPHNLYCTQLN